MKPETHTERPAKATEPGGRHHASPLPHDELTDQERLGHAASVEQQTFAPGKDAPDPMELTGSASESPWASKAPGSKRRW